MKTLTSNIKIIITAVTAIFAISVLAEAQSIGSISYGGTGCPRGSMSFAFSPDNQDLVLTYDAMLVQSGKVNGKKIDRKSCGLIIPLQAPQGYQVALATMSDGDVFIQKGGKATLNLESFYAGSTGLKNSKVYKSAGHYKVAISDTVATVNSAWSTCGASTNLRMNLSAITQGDASLLLDQLQFKILFRRCQN